MPRHDTVLSIFAWLSSIALLPTKFGPLSFKWSMKCMLRGYKKPWSTTMQHMTFGIVDIKHAPPTSMHAATAWNITSVLAVRPSSTRIIRTPQAKSCCMTSINTTCAACLVHLEKLRRHHVLILMIGTWHASLTALFVPIEESESAYSPLARMRTLYAKLTCEN